MTRCGTCWIVLKPGQSVEEHAASSQWHRYMAIHLSIHSERSTDA